jgi:hypothetical protein
VSDLILDPSHGMEQPALIVAFTGWSDAVEASSRAVGFLRDTLQAKPVGGIRADDYYDLTTVRPHAVIRHGGKAPSPVGATSCCSKRRNPALAGRPIARP